MILHVLLVNDRHQSLNDVIKKSIHNENDHTNCNSTCTANVIKDLVPLEILLFSFNTFSGSILYFFLVTFDLIIFSCLVCIYYTIYPPIYVTPFITVDQGDDSYVTRSRSTPFVVV